MHVKAGQLQSSSPLSMTALCTGKTVVRRTTGAHGPAPHRACGKTASVDGDGRAAGAQGAGGIHAQLPEAVHQVLDGPLAHARHPVQRERTTPGGGHRRAQWPAAHK